MYNVPQTVTRELLESQVIQKTAQDELEKALTDEELKDLADKYGYSSFWTGKKSDIERFLTSDDAKTAYVDLLMEQYRAAGLAE